jgi:hypothetical protein
MSSDFARLRLRKRDELGHAVHADIGIGDQDHGSREQQRNRHKLPYKIDAFAFVKEFGIPFTG